METAMLLNNRPSTLFYLLWSFAFLSLIQASNIEGQAFSNIPEIYNVRCDVRDLETAIKWNVTEPDESLALKRYFVRFCPPTECRHKQKLHCFKDNARTKKLPKVEDTYCKASVSQLLTWGPYYFKITAIYRNVTSGKSMRISNYTVCEPITRQTTLSAPNITTLATKTSITITLNLDQNLQRTLEKTKHQGDLSMSDVTYYYYLISKGGRLKRSKPSPERKSLNYYETYENIAPNEEYDIKGWYTIKTLKDEKSEIASTRERTKPDRFPQWAQIMFLCGLSSLVILAMITGITCREYRKRENKVKEGKFKSTLRFEKWLNDIHNADPWLMDTFEEEEPVILAQLFTKQEVLLDTADSAADNALAEFQPSREAIEISTLEADSHNEFVSEENTPSFGDYDRNPMQDYMQVVSV